MTYSTPTDPSFRMTKCSKTGCNNMQLYHTMFVSKGVCRICRECYFKDLNEASERMKAKYVKRERIMA